MHVLDEAFVWACEQRSGSSPNNDIWSSRANWNIERVSLLEELQSGLYRFSPQRSVYRFVDGSDDLDQSNLIAADKFGSCSADIERDSFNKDGFRCHNTITRQTPRPNNYHSQKPIDIWSARDLVVLKALTIILSKLLPVHVTCTHINGYVGLKAAVKSVSEYLSDNRLALRTDVKSYCASIDQIKLLVRLSVYIRDRRLINLVGQYLIRSTEYGSTFKDFEQDISRGCPLSLLMAALYLHELDEAIAKQPVFYIRYMDYIVVLATNRHKLRRAIAIVNRVLSSLSLVIHPDKTTIGPIERGFDYLSYHFSRAGLSLAQITINNFKSKLSRHYEQNGKRRQNDWGWSPKTNPARTIETIITTYINRFRGWTFGGLEDVPCIIGDDLQTIVCRSCRDRS